MLRQSSFFQQRGLFPEITSESAQALEAQRHTLVQEATAEMIRRDAHSADTLSQLRSEFQLHHLHAESQTDEFQQCEAGVRHYLERSNTYGGQFRSHYEETSTAIASIAPEVSRLRARENNSSPTSRRFNFEIRSYRDSCKNLRQENARINAHVNQIHIAKGSMHTRNKELTQQLQTSDNEIGRLQVWSLWSSKFGGKKSIYRKSGTTAPLVTAPLETHRSLLYEVFSVASEVSSSAFGFSPVTVERNLVQEKRGITSSTRIT